MLWVAQFSLSPPSTPSTRRMDGAATFLLLSLVSSWLNLVLYTAELFLCRQYLQLPGRPLLHKLSVVALVVFDTICTLSTLVSVGFATVPIHTTNIRLLLAPVSITILATYSSAAIAQLFLCKLFFQLTKNTLVVGLLVLLIAVHCAFSFASAIMILTKMSVFGIVLTATTVGAISCAVTDISIAFCLAYKFWKMLRSTGRATSTHNLVRRILILTISSGAMVASTTLIMMILLLRASPAFQFFFSCQGRVYALTILGNFLLGIPGVQDNTAPSAFTLDRRDASADSEVVFHVAATYPDSGISLPRVDIPPSSNFSKDPHHEEHMMHTLKPSPV
ncbi:hypothetical protein DFH09DRAFT_1145965 [Mycena vulgaris]|nr:hypothetical protein DFH09DRAFT_1145965 [Mycena vulgaris]